MTVVKLVDARARRKRGRRLAARGRTCADPAFPSSLRCWIDRHQNLLHALHAVRRLGEHGREAVEVLSALWSVARARHSSELWAAIVEGDGNEAEALLLEVLLPSELEFVRQALWGAGWADELDPTPTGRGAERPR